MGNHFMDTLYDGGTPHTNDPDAQQQCFAGDDAQRDG